MLRSDSTRIGPQSNGSDDFSTDAAGQAAFLTPTGSVDIQQELNKLEELVLSSPRIPLSRRTLVDEDQLLDQLDLIRLSLPTAFREAAQIVQQREALVAEAQRYAQDLVASAEKQAAQILDELGIIRQAEQMAQQLKTQTQRDCESVKSQTLAEIDQMRLQAQRELEAMRQQALTEKESIEADADDYANDVLGQIERQLTDMLRVIQNGRTQLQRPAKEIPPVAPAPTPKRSQDTSNSVSRNYSSARSDRPRR